MQESRRKIGLFACLAIAAVFSGVHGKPPSRIAGGLYVKPGELPYMVGVMEGDRHICGGAIISTRHILTAGHCVENPRNLSVVSGIVDINDSNRTVHKVSKFLLHPEFVPYTPTTNLERDIALIVLKDDLNLNDELSAVKLPWHQVLPGSNGIIAGWGWTSSANTPTSYLMKLDVTLLSREICDQKHGFFTGDRICGYAVSGTICGGDSGGPLIVGSTIVGIASASRCTIGEAHLYTNVYYYMNWITESMRST